jgi:uncharacterized protein (DUF362 family)
MGWSVHETDRRGFLRSVGTGLAVVPFVGGGVFGQASAARRSRVVVVRAADRKKGVTEILKLMDLAGAAGKRVLLKPNFNSADEPPGGTHNDTLVQLVAELKQRNVRSITVADSCFAKYSTQDVMQKKGIFDLGRDMQFEVVNLDDTPDGDWVKFGPEGTHWPDGFHLARRAVESEYTVSTCCLKAHGAGGVFTMSLKNAVGLTPKPIRMPVMHKSPDMRRMIAELNIGYRPSLILMDAVVAMTDGGPFTGQVKQANALIGGTDRVAVDAVGVALLKSLGTNEAIMSSRIFAQEQIARAVELKLGAAGPDEIEIVTPADADSRALADALRPILAQG